MGHSPADDAYERALRDDAFLCLVRRHYRGPHDVLDALWWLTHPAEPAPSGATAPAVDVAELQRRVYSPGARNRDTMADAARLARLQEQLRVDGQAIHAAVAAASAPGLQSQPVGIEPVEANPVAGQAAAGTADAAGIGDAAGPADPAGHENTGDGQEADATPAAHADVGSLPRRRNALIGAGIAITLVAGIVVGSQLGPALATLGSQSTGPNTAPSATPVSRVPSGMPSGYDDVFRRFQVAGDVPEIPLPDSFIPGTFRTLIEFTGSQLFAVRTTSQAVCVLAVVTATQAYSASCQSPQEVPPSGLRIGWQVDTGIVIRDYEVTWKTDGSIVPVIVPRQPDAVPAFAPPPVSPDEVIRVVIDDTNQANSATGTVPADTAGYRTEIGCISTVQDTSIGYILSTVSDPDNPVVSGGTECGTRQTDVAFVPPMGTDLQLTLIGDLSLVTSAYGIVTPIPPDVAPEFTAPGGTPDDGYWIEPPSVED